MTIQLQDPYRYHLTDGQTTSWGAPQCVNAEDLKVFTVGPGDVRTTLIIGDDFTVSGAGSDTVSIDTGAPLAQGLTLWIFSEVALVQLSEYTETGRFPALTVESDFDRVVLMIQQLNEKLGRALLQDPTTPAGSRGIVFPSGVANAIIGWDAEGKKLVNVSRSALGGFDGVAGDPAIYTAEDIGLAGDGITDDSNKLNLHLQETAAKGGGLYILKADKAFYFKYRVRVPSFISLAFTSPIVASAANGGGIRSDGKMAEWPEQNLLRLLENATAGASTLRIDTGPQGGGVLSSMLKVGDVLNIRGLSDGSLNSLEREKNVITAIDDGTKTVTLRDPLSFAYLVTYPAGDYEAAFGVVDRTYITRDVFAALTADGVEGSDTVTCDAGQLDELDVGDWVMAEDLELSVSGNPVNRELAQVLEITGSTVKLNRRLGRSLATANDARITKMRPAIRNAVTGASITFIDAPLPAPASRRHAFEIVNSVDCRWTDNEVPNTTDFSCRGQMFRLYTSYNCGFDRCGGRNPKSLASGDGYGHGVFYSTDCRSTGLTFSGCRHSALFQGATDCEVDGLTVRDDRLAAVDFHGLGEVRCVVRNADLQCASGTASSTNTAMKSGNPSHRHFSRDCGIENFKISGYSGASQTAFRFDPGSDGCFARRGEVRDSRTGLIHKDNANDGALLTTNCSIEEVVFDSLSGWVADLNGGANGSTAKTMQGITLRDINARKCPFMFRVTQVSGFRLIQSAIIVNAPDLSEPFVLVANDVDVLSVIDCVIDGAHRGFALTDCPGFIIAHNGLLDFGDALILDDRGANDDGQWILNSEIGFTGSRSGGSSTITERPSIGSLILNT